MRRRQRDDAADAQIDEGDERRKRDRRQQPVDHKVRVERQRQHDMLKRPEERNDGHGKSRVSRQDLKPRQHVAVIGRLLDYAPHQRKDQHRVERRKERQGLKNLRRIEVAIDQQGADVVPAQDKEEARRDQRKAKQDIAPQRLRWNPIRSRSVMPSRRANHQSRERQPASIKVPYTGSQAPASRQGVADPWLA